MYTLSIYRYYIYILCVPNAVQYTGTHYNISFSEKFFFIFTIINTILLIINNTIKIRHTIQHLIMQYILIHLISIEIDIFL